MHTDIRMMVEGLRPVADFREHVERTITVLNTRLEDIFVCDADDAAEKGELGDLLAFWSRLLEATFEAE